MRRTEPKDLTWCFRDQQGKVLRFDVLNATLISASDKRRPLHMAPSGKFDRRRCYGKTTWVYRTQHGRFVAVTTDDYGDEAAEAKLIPEHRARTLFRQHSEFGNGCVRVSNALGEEVTQ